MPVTDRKPQGAWFALVAGIAEMAAVEEAVPRAGWEGRSVGGALRRSGQSSGPCHHMLRGLGQEAAVSPSRLRRGWDGLDGV